MNEWQPIETAPTNGRSVLLALSSKHVTVGRWEPQQFHKTPRPYWSTERGWLFGISWDRKNQPTHWMPLPDPPRDACPFCAAGDSPHTLAHEGKP